MAFNTIKDIITRSAESFSGMTAIKYLDGKDIIEKKYDDLKSDSETISRILDKSVWLEAYSDNRHEQLSLDNKLFRNRRQRQRSGSARRFSAGGRTSRTSQPRGRCGFDIR